jgi:aspartate/methionine/tyrosine aminotransferase
MSQTLSRPLAARVTKLAAAPPPVDTASTPVGARDAAVEALETDKTHYTTRPGIVPLREWVSAHLEQQYGLSIPVDAITITCGAQEAEFVALKTLVPADSSLLYSGGAKVREHLERYIPLLEFTPVDTPDAQVSAVYAGAGASPDWLAQAVDNGWWVIWPAMFAGHDSSIARVVGAAARTVVIGELEDRLPGWRIGWMAGSEQANALRAYKQSMTICSPSISQWAAYGLVSADHD